MQAILLELKWLAQDYSLRQYQPLLRAQRRACLALKQALEEKLDVLDPQPERVTIWLRENELGFYFRVEYKFHRSAKIVNGMTTNIEQKVFFIDYQLTLDDLRDENGKI